MNIEDFFRKMVEIEASDLYLTVAKPPMYRTEGKIEVGGDHPFTPEELRDIAQAIMNDKQKQEFDRNDGNEHGDVPARSFAFPRKYISAARLGRHGDTAHQGRRLIGGANGPAGRSLAISS